MIQYINSSISKENLPLRVSGFHNKNSGNEKKNVLAVLHQNHFLSIPYLADLLGYIKLGCIILLSYIRHDYHSCNCTS